MSTPTLSPRERQVVHAIMAGESGPRIALTLGISARTVKEYVQRVDRKLPAQLPGAPRHRILTYFLTNGLTPPK